MTKTVKLISGVGFTRGTAWDLRAGLIGYVTLTFADLLLIANTRDAKVRALLTLPNNLQYLAEGGSFA